MPESMVWSPSLSNRTRSPVTDLTSNRNSFILAGGSTLVTWTVQELTSWDSTTPTSGVGSSISTRVNMKVPTMVAMATAITTSRTVPTVAATPAMSRSNRAALASLRFLPR
jgi:hypothetical protein